MDYFSKVKEAVLSGQIEGKIVEHPEIDGSKSEDAARAIGMGADSILKSLLLVPDGNREGVPIVAILRGADKIDLKGKFPNHRMARIEELEKILGTGIGQVPPVLLPVPVIIDEKVFSKETVAGSAGTKFAGLLLTPEEIKKGNRLVRVAKISL